MRSSSWWKAGVTDILVLIAGFLPLFLLLAGALARVSGAEESGDLLGTASVLYPGFVAPVLLGGVLYLLCLFALAQRQRAHRRVWAVGLTPLVALGFLPFGMRDVLTLNHFLIALVIGLLLYGLVVRFPQGEHP